MAISHKNIPTSERHNPKDFEAAGNNTVAKKNSAGNLEWGTVDTVDITDDAVTNDKIAAGSVTNIEIAADGISNGNIADGEIGAEKLQTGSDERAWVLARTAASDAGFIGTYGMLENTGGPSLTAGDEVSGTVLSWSSATGTTGAQQSGTWKCMGNCPNGEVSIFLKVSS